MRNIKIIGVITGLFLLIGSGVVVGLTVVRIQNQKPTVVQPKAAGVSWPSCVQDQSKAYWCTNDDCFNSSDDSRNILKCCNQVGSNPFACAWPARGWCKPPPEQCPASGGQRCALYFFNQGSACYGYTAGGGGGASFTATYPVGGATVDSLQPTFTWTANTTGLSYNCLNVHTDQCQTPIPSLSGCPSTADRSWKEAGKLAPNTTYYWVIYGQPGWPAPGSGCQSFKTGAGGPTCQTGQTVCGTNCCNANQSCVNGSCLTAQQFFGCVNKTCAVVSGAAGNSNGCTSAGGTCCASGADCSSDQTCDSTATPNTCSTTGEIGSCWGDEGANGRCYDCNGDGAINILDFSCFAKNWLQNVSP